MNDKALKAQELYKKGESLKDIATTFGVSVSGIRNWKRRYNWDGKNATPKTSVEITEPLNDNQRLFCEYYADNRNATQAYVNAYGASRVSANTLGPRLLSDIRIRSYVEELLRLKREAIMLEADDIVEKYMKIAFSNITDFVEFGARAVVEPNENGEMVVVGEENFIILKSSAEVDGGLVAKISKSKDSVFIQLEDRQKALDWLAKYFNMFPQDKFKQEYDNKRFELQERAIVLQENKAQGGADESNELEKLLEGLKTDE